MAQIQMAETRVQARTERDKLDDLYRVYAPDAVRLAYLLTGDPALAEDLTHDAFVRVFGRFRDLRSPDAFWWYLRKTVVNLSRSHFRRKRIERAFLERERGRPEGVTSFDTDDRGAMREALMELRPAQRAAVVLRYYEDLTEAQTADVLGWPIGTVKSTVSRAMERLRTELSKEAANDG